MDPSLDDLSRSLMGTLCDGIQSDDRAVIINCLEILYKLCQKDSNEDYINKCLNLKFYETICLYLSLNDIMLLIFTLEAIYALTSMGARSCHIIMQVRGIVDQLVSLISVEAQAYGPDGCILMRVVETVPGNMLPMVAQNIANLQNVQQQQQQNVLNKNNNNNKTTTTVSTTVTTTPTINNNVSVPQQQQQLPLKIPTSTVTAATLILQQQTQILQQPTVKLTTTTGLLQQQPNQQVQPILQQQQQQNINAIDKQIQQPKTAIIQQQQPAVVTTTSQQQCTTVTKSQSPGLTPTSAPSSQTNPQILITTSSCNSTSTSTMVGTTITTTTTSTNQFTQDDEQYALAWLAATFERAAGVESRIEHQDLYRMYLTHCQKAGKYSVVNHMQFPHLVRIIFGNNVGPAIVRRADGMEYSGRHYVAIKMRAQPLPIQIKTTTITAAAIPQLSTVSSLAQQSQSVVKNSPDLKKYRKKLPMQQQQQQQCIDDGTNNKLPIVTPTTTTTNSTIAIIKSSEGSIISTINSVATSMDISPKLVFTSNSNSSITTTKAIITSNIQLSPANVTSQLQNQQQQQHHQPPPLQQQAQTQPSSSSLIKSLLANKVNQRQQKQKQEQIITQTSTNMTNNNIQQQQQTPIKVTSNAISALVNNPLMQNTPVKVGQTTIKPLNPQIVQMDKKLQQQQQQQQQQHGVIIESSAQPPPLAPLSGNNVIKDTSGRSMIIANQMLVDILDKKTGEPPIPATIIKRKMIDDPETINCQSIKRLAYDANGSVIRVISNSSNNSNSSNSSGNGNGNGNNNVMTPSKNAANFYAEMAASILEDEDIEDIPTLMTHGTPIATPTPPPPPVPTPPQQQQQQQILLPAKIQQNIPRQLIFQTPGSSNIQPHQLKLSGQPTAMATIKTDQGLQTVPVILQQKSLDSSQTQYVLQPHQQQTTTQYVLATNQQGQTYLVAQQTPALQATQTQLPPCTATTTPTQTVLLTQTPQQHAAGTKTIIIVQQQALQPQQQQQQQHQQHQQQLVQIQQPLQQQKMIMTTQQGQQVLLTQRTPVNTPTPSPPTPIIINPGTSGNTMLQRQLQQSNSGQISPTLLSQLTHIPATIKLHQPSVICNTNNNSVASSPTTATITRVAKPLNALPMQIPQLQQHSSIIQQHIISGNNNNNNNNNGEKRQVILAGGRAIEIKETIIASKSAPHQQHQHAIIQNAQTSLLNSQTIITHSPRPNNVVHMDTTTNTTNTSTISAATTSTPSIIQQRISNINTNNSGILLSSSTATTTTAITKPTFNVTTSTPQSVPAQVIMTQSALGKKTPTVIQRPITAGVIKSSNTMTGINNNSNGNGGPPPLAVNSSMIQSTLQAQEITEDLPKTPPLTKTPTPPLAIHRASTPASTNNNNNNNNNVTNVATTTTTATSSAITTATPTPITTTAMISTTINSNVTNQPLLNTVDINWPYVCDWRNCPRRKFKSLNDLQQHACTVHCPEHLEAGAEIFCQWGVGPGLCDGIPRKRYSLMTHLIDRHITTDALRQAVQRRINNGAANLLQPTQPPVTIIRNMSDVQRGNTASPALSSSSSSSVPATGSSALQAIQRHTADYVNSKELMDENEGPVTKSIRLTAALILRNLVTYTNTAKRSLRRYEQHLANIALSNVESSGTVAHILLELSN